MPDLTTLSLHRLAVHVLARARQAASGRIGLRATPGGFGTPSFGPPDDPEVLRVAGTFLLRERGGALTALRLDGRSLRDAAEFAGVDLAAPFDAGHDTPPVGDPDAILTVDAAEAAALADWFDLGWRLLDELATFGTEPVVVQLWPEHFDAGCSVSIRAELGHRCNVGVSPGDAAVPEPYLYVGPWGSERPGDGGYWNAPFGAVLRRSEVGADPLGAGRAFIAEGLGRLI